MSVGLLIAVAVGVGVGRTSRAWIAASSGAKLIQPNNGQLDSHPPQKLTLLDPGRVATVPIVSPSTRLPEIEVIVNGRPTRFMVDTGSSHVWVLSNALETLGLQMEAEMNARHQTVLGRGFSRLGYVKQPVPFALGKGTSVQVETVLVLPAESEISYAGILSGSFLETIGGSLDFRDRTLRIDGPRGRPASPDNDASSGNKPGKP